MSKDVRICTVSPNARPCWSRRPGGICGARENACRFAVYADDLMRENKKLKEQIEYSEADDDYDNVADYNDGLKRLQDQNNELRCQNDKLKKQNEELKKQIENLKNQKNPAKQRVAICKSNGVDCGNKFLSDGVCKNYDMCSCKKILFLTDAEFANFIAQRKANVRE